MDRRFFVEVGFRRLDQERTQIDPDFHVPVNGQAYGLLETCRGIVRWQTFDRQDTRDGAVAVLRGVLSVPVASDPELKPGDKVERVAGKDLQPPVYVISIYTAAIRGKPAWVRYELASREVA